MAIKGYIFQEIIKRGKEIGITKADLKTAASWYRTQARKVRSVNVNRLLTEAPKSRLFSRGSESDIGSMIMFFYDAKHKDTLPYYDQFPLVFPIEYYKDGFLSINLHYLSRFRRAQLMNALYETAQKEKDKIVRLNINYRILKSAAKFSAFRPCVKKHLFSQVRSRFLYVPPKEWDMALMLPTERFVGAQKEKVWRDSNKIIRNG